jgi:Na+/proline symporter
MNEASALLDPTIGWVLLVVLSVIWVGLGVYWGRKASNLEGFMLAGRNVGLALGTATAVATWITSNTTMLAPQFALQLGVWGMLAYCTASFGLFLFAPMAERIRALMPNGYTSAEFVRLRYGNFAWGIFLVISLFYGITWMISMGMAGGILMEALAGIPYVYGMTAILLVCVLYTLFGGLFAVIGTDFIQSWIILVGVCVVAIAVLSTVSIDEIYANLERNRPALLDVLFPAAIMAVFNNMLFGLGEIFHSNVWWSRAFAMREGVGRKAYGLAGLVWLPIPIVAGFLGLAAPAMDINIARPDMVGPVVAGTVLGTFGAVLVFVVVFASLASSIDSLLAAMSDLVLNDFVKQMFARDATDAQLRRWGMAVIIGIGLVTWLICVPRVGTLASVLFFAGPLVGSAIWPIIAGLYWQHTNRHGAVAAMLLGSVGGLITYFAVGWYAASLIGTAVSMVVVVVTTRFAPQSFDWKRLDAGPHTVAPEEAA